MASRQSQLSSVMYTSAPWALVIHRLLMLVSGSDLLKFGFLLSGETLSLAGDLFYNISSTLLLLDVQR